MDITAKTTLTITMTGEEAIALVTQINEFWAGGDIGAGEPLTNLLNALTEVI